jgi:HEPN domain-containing protein
MNPLALEWVDKAEGDFATAQRELRARKSPNFDAACFHTQQMAEKYLKAYLQNQDFAPPRIHDLVEILTLCLTINPALGLLEPDLKNLNAYAVQFRYPGQSAGKSDAQSAIKSAKLIRAHLRILLNLE